MDYYIRRDKAKPAPLKEQLMTSPYNEDELEQIARLNFENWIHYHREIVELLYTWPKDRSVLDEYTRDNKVQGLSKILRRGVEFGVLSTWDGAHLTIEAEKYYKSLLIKEREIIGGGQERNDVNI